MDPENQNKSKYMLKLLEELKIPAFPGGRTLRKPMLTLALSWYALLDRI